MYIVYECKIHTLIYATHNQMPFNGDVRTSESASNIQSSQFSMCISLLQWNFCCTRSYTHTHMQADRWSFSVYKLNNFFTDKTYDTHMHIQQTSHVDLKNETIDSRTERRVYMDSKCYWYLLTDSLSSLFYSIEHIRYWYAYT